MSISVLFWSEVRSYYFITNVPKTLFHVFVSCIKKKNYLPKYENWGEVESLLCIFYLTDTVCDLMHDGRLG